VTWTERGLVPPSKSMISLMQSALPRRPRIARKALRTKRKVRRLQRLPLICSWWPRSPYWKPMAITVKWDARAYGCSGCTARNAATFVPCSVTTTWMSVSTAAPEPLRPPALASALRYRSAA